MGGSSPHEPARPVFQFSDALTPQIEYLSSVVTERFKKAGISVTQPAFELELQKELARRLDFAAGVFDEPKGRENQEDRARTAFAKLTNLQLHLAR